MCDAVTELLCDQDGVWEADRARDALVESVADAVHVVHVPESVGGRVKEGVRETVGEAPRVPVTLLERERDCVREGPVRVGTKVSLVVLVWDAVGEWDGGDRVHDAEKLPLAVAEGVPLRESESEHEYEALRVDVGDMLLECGDAVTAGLHVRVRVPPETERELPDAEGVWDVVPVALAVHVRGPVELRVPEGDGGDTVGNKVPDGDTVQERLSEKLGLWDAVVTDAVRDAERLPLGEQVFVRDTVEVPLRERLFLPVRLRVADLVADARLLTLAVGLHDSDHSVVSVAVWDREPDRDAEWVCVPEAGLKVAVGRGVMVCDAETLEVPLLVSEGLLLGVLDGGVGLWLKEAVMVRLGVGLWRQLRDPLELWERVG